jgi:hypothetical protein
MPEQLFQCPKCGQPNFTASGLRAHMKTNRCANAAITLDAETGSPLDTENLTLETSSAVSTADISAVNLLHRSAQLKAASAKEAAEEAARLAVIAGIRLIRIKEATPHGGWSALFSSADRRLTDSSAANGNHGCHFEFSDDTARRYIAAAESCLGKPGLPKASRKAIEALALADVPMIDEEGRKHLDAATNGKTLRQLYLDFGIIRPTADEAFMANRNTKGGPTGKRLSKLEAHALRKGDILGAYNRWMLEWDHMGRAGDLEWIDRPDLENLLAFLDSARTAVRTRLK